MLLHEHTVRFGDVMYGGRMHSARVFDLTIRALESLTADFKKGFSDIISRDGVPYAPVDVRGSFPQYPSLGETIHVSGTVLDVGSKHFEVEYRFETESGPLGRIRMVHITVAPGGGAESLRPADREHLLDARTSQVETKPLPGYSDGTEDPMTTFEKEVTFRSPYIEAAGLGYIEDYFGFISAAVEDHLDACGTPLSSMSTGSPLVPVEFAFEFPKPIPFEDEIQICGRVLEVEPTQITVQYELNAAETGETRIQGRQKYACFDDQQEETSFPERILIAFR